MQHNAVNLLDLPLPWLTQLALRQLYRRTKQSFFQTCKAIRDLYLEQSDDVQCQVPSRGWTVAQAASSLHLLTRCKDGAEVKLIVKDCDNITTSFTTWLRSLCSHASISPGLPLHHVTCVELQGYMLGDMVPPELAMACPKLTHLIRWGKFCTLEGNAFAPVACSQLKKLTIDHLGQAKAQHNQAPLSESQLQQQLRSLPNLQDLNCTVSMEGIDANFSYLAYGIQALSKQLTSLQVESMATHGFTMLVTNPWPQLRVLRMPEYHMRDSDELQVLCQRAPSLVELELLDMANSKKPVPRPSNSLRLLKVANACLANFAHFPLADLTQFRFQNLVIEAHHEQHVQGAAAMLTSTTTKFVTDRKDGALAIYIAVVQEPAPGLAPLLCMLPHKCLMLSGVKVVVGDKWIKVLADLGCKHLLTAPQALPTTS